MIKFFLYSKVLFFITISILSSTSLNACNEEIIEGKTETRRIIIRAEKKQDSDAIGTVIKNAFAGRDYSTNNEDEFIDALRMAGALSVALVAERDSEVVGYIAFSPITIDGKDVRWFCMALLSVSPNLQKQGIGTQLVKAGLDKLKQLDGAGCVLLGDPGYYVHFGFAARKELTLQGESPEYFLVLPFEENMPQGNVQFHPVFADYP